MDEEKNYVANLSMMHIDALKELGNIGSGNAATALSSMLNTKVDMNIPSVKILDIQEIANVIGGAGNQAAGIKFTLYEDFSGMMMFVMEKQFAQVVLNILMNKNRDSFDKFEELGEMDMSAIKEVGNIIVSSYINAIARMTNMKIALSPPDIYIDTAKNLFNIPAIGIDKYGEKILFIQDGFINGQGKVTSYFLLIPEIKSLKKIFQAFGMDI